MHNQAHESQQKFSKSPQFLLQATPSILLRQQRKLRKRTKTVCTIGPKTQSPQNALKIIDEGMNVARLNFSHGDHQSHKILMNGVLQALKSRPQLHTAIMLDTKGPEIRTGNNLGSQIIELKSGQQLQITTDYNHLGTNQRIACSYKDLPKSTGIGKKILIADGSISTKVIKIQGEIVTVQVENNGKIGNKKNMCLPGTVISLPTIGPADQYDILNFGLKNKVNSIAVSFSRYKKDLDNLRKLIIEKDPQHGPFVQLISKIQNHQGILNLDQIIQGSDGIMVARGDLGMEVPIQKVVILQKYITQRAIYAGKFVITATQMLQSMQTNPRPTRAQVADVTNAVFDLTDANMTSGETTTGQFPTQCARTLRLIAQESEALCNYEKSFEYRKKIIKDKSSIAIVSSSFQMNCHFIFIRTENIKFIHRISTLRPKAFIIIFSDNNSLKGAVATDFGVYVHSLNDAQPEQFCSKFKQLYGYTKEDQIRILQAKLLGNQLQQTKIIYVKTQ